MNNLMELFVRDSRHYLSQIIDSLISYERNSSEKDFIDAAFRAIHSIKTESSYLQLREISEISHEVEDKLELLRSNRLSFTKEICEELITRSEKLQVLIEKIALEKPESAAFFRLDDHDSNGEMLTIPDQYRKPPVEEDNFDIIEISLESEDEASGSGESTAADEQVLISENAENGGSSAAHVPDSFHAEKITDSIASKMVSADIIPESADPASGKTEREMRRIIQREFNDFQVQLLNDAMKRGEKLYRIICDISAESCMKYPRLYLIVNNLELHTNLIKTLPGLSEIEKDQATRITCYITTKKKYDELYSLINVDEVKSIQIINLPYEFYFSGHGVFNDKEREDYASKNIPVKIEKLDSLFVSVQDMMMALLLKAEHIRPEEDRILYNILKKMETDIRKLRMVTLSEEFSSVPAVIRKMAYSKGKEVDISFNDNNIEIDRSIFEHIYDPVIHILKNAVDHGIEKVEKRLEAGKNRKGKIVCSANLEDGFLKIEIDDDGKGIDLDKIAEMSGYTVTELEDPEKLLAIISSAGFTTKKDADEHSGRGFGMNLVQEKISQIEGASLRLVTKKGAGTAIQIFLPDTCIAQKVIFVLCGNDITAIPFESVRGKVTITESDIQQNEKGQLFYGSTPVYTKNGLLFSGNLTKKDSKGVLLEKNGRKGVLLVDRILFSQALPSDRMFLLQTSLPYLYSLRIAGQEKEYSYLDSLILEYAG